MSSDIEGTLTEREGTLTVECCSAEREARAGDTLELRTASILDQRLHIELEVMAEKASTLKRVANGLEKLCAQLAALEAEGRVATGARRAELEKRHEEVREEARKQLWYLIVQREAMGFTRHDDVYEIYKVPRSLTF